jgi:quinol monooxygenase YgiN
MTADGAQVAIVCRLVARPGRRPALVQALGRILEVSREENGTQVYAVLEAVSDEVTAYLFELFRDDRAYSLHRASEVHADVVARLDEWLDPDRPGEIIHLRPVGITLMT